MSTRSRTGCMTCRKRKLKCDEVKPICGQCTKARRECIPCSGIVFRHQQNASMNQERGTDPSNLANFYQYKNTFNENNVWVQVPKRVTFVINNDPYAEGSQDLEEFAEDYNRAPYANMTAQTLGPRLDGAQDEQLHGPEWAPAQFPRQYNGSHGLEALSEAASVGQYSYLPVGGTPQRNNTTKPSIQATEALSRLATSASEQSSSTNSLSFLLNPTSPTQDAAIDPNLERLDPQLRKQSQAQDVEPDFELAYLLRHFADEPAHWLDLFDRHSFFKSFVASQSPLNPLLRYCAAALSAKHLAHIQVQSHERKVDEEADVSKDQDFQQARVEWVSKAALYYDKATSMLADVMQSQSTSGERSINLNADTRNSKRRKLSPPSEYTADELAAASAILCQYEVMNAAGNSFEWPQPFDKGRSMLDVAEYTTIPLRPTHSPSAHPSTGVLAAFWNFAWQDLLSALVNEKHTQLDPEDTALWKDAGILLDEEGFVQPDSPSNGVTGSSGDIAAKEQLMGNAIVWLLAKIINYAVYADHAPTTGDEDKDRYMGINQLTLHERWDEIRRQVDVWHERLPSTFAPSPKVRFEENRDDSSVFQPVRYPSRMIATAMLLYHMAQKLLLINRPQHSTIGKTTLFKRLGSYKTIAAGVESHARLICSIARTHIESSVRIHAIQPLFLAGQCLEEGQERNEILAMLKGIQDETGWETDYRVVQLLGYWEDSRQ